MQILGHDTNNVQCKFEPVFLARNNSYYYDNGNSNYVYNCADANENPMLGNLLLKACHWLSTSWGYATSADYHYLPEIEDFFYRQYALETGFDEDNTGISWVDPYAFESGYSYEDAHLSGFQCYQYSTYKLNINPVNNYLIPLSFEALHDATHPRNGDKLQWILDCYTASRMSSPTNAPTIINSSKIQIEKSSLSRIFPNPMTETGGQVIINSPDVFSFKFNDVYGNDVTNKIEVEKTEGNKYLLFPRELENGVYMLSATEKNQKKYNCTFSVVK